MLLVKPHGQRGRRERPTSRFHLRPAGPADWGRLRKRAGRRERRDLNTEHLFGDGLRNSMLPQGPAQGEEIRQDGTAKRIAQLGCEVQTTLGTLMRDCGKQRWAHHPTLIRCFASPSLQLHEKSGTTRNAKTYPP